MKYLMLPVPADGVHHVLRADQKFLHQNLPRTKQSAEYRTAVFSDILLYIGESAIVINQQQFDICAKHTGGERARAQELIELNC